MQNGIQDHSFWKNAAFWEQAVTKEIEEELASQNKLPSMEIENTQDKEMRYELLCFTLPRERNIMFGKLTTFAHNMMEFKINPDIAKEVILRLSKEKNLQEEQVVELIVPNFPSFK